MGEEGDDSSRVDSFRDGGHLPLVVAVVSLVTVVALETQSVSTILPRIKADLDGLSLYGWVFAGFSLAQIGGIVFAGVLADRRGLAAPVAIGLLFYVAGLAVGATAPSMVVLVAGRVLQGFGAGTVPAVCYVAIGRGLPESLRPKAFAYLSTAWILPSLVGPLGANYLAKAAGWRWVFGGLIPIAALVGGSAIGALGRLSVGSGSAVPDDSAVPSTVALLVGVAAVLVGFDTRPRVVGVAMVILGCVVTLAALRRRTPVGTLSFRRGLPSAIGLRGLLTCGFFGVDAFITLGLVEVRHTSTDFGALVVASSAFLWTAGSWTQARLTGRVRPRQFVRVGLGLVAIAGLLMTWIITSSAPVGLAVPVWLLAGFGIGVSYSPLSLVTLANAEEGREGFATSALQLTDVLGVSIGTGVVGMLIDVFSRDGSPTVSGIRWAFLGPIVVAGFGCALAGRLDVRRAAVPAATVRRPGH